MFFENEGTEGEVEQLSGVENESSQETQIDPQAAAKETAAVEQKQEVPFHEHPRWKEVMEERNAERQRAQALEQKIAEMHSRLQESLKPKSDKPDFNTVRTKMGERLKGIDPEFQEYMSLLEDQAVSAKQELAQFREEQFVNRALSRLEELNKQNSVTPEVAPLYQAQLDRAYREGKIRSVEDLDRAYKAIHEPFSKMLEARERSVIEKYTATKKQDAKKPTSQPKGRAPAQGETKFSSNPQEAKAQLIKTIASHMKASREV